MKKQVLLVLIIILILISSCNKDDAIISPEFSVDGEVEIVFENNPNGINVIFLGEGFSKYNFQKPMSNYRKYALNHIEYLFSKPPFSEYKEHFNAYIVYVISEDEGISKEGEPLKNTAFGAVLTNYSIPVQIEYSNILKVHDYVRKAVPSHTNENSDDLVLLSINGGRGGSGGNGLATFKNTMKATMLHEIGHAFANLGDEYIRIPNPDFIIDTETYTNLDTNNNPNEIKWSHFIGLENYSNVGIFEGGGYVSSGIWRPTENSIMRYGGYGDSFNAPSREAIVKRIMDIRNLEYDFQDFLEKDVLSPDL